MYKNREEKGTNLQFKNVLKNQNKVQTDRKKRGEY